MVKGFQKYYLATVFLMILVLPLLNNSLKIWHFERAKENRVFHDTIAFDIQKLDLFPAEFEAYYNDNFAFRTPLLDFYHKIKFRIFGVSPNEEQLIMGRDGWYFLGGKDKEIFEGRKEFTPQELAQFNNIWGERLNYFKKQNIKAYWLICPTKLNIYSDKLPFNVMSTDKPTRTSTLIHYLNKTLPAFILDPTDLLLKNKKHTKLYYQLDNHWNAKAGNLVSRLLLQTFKKDFPLLDEQFLDKYHWKDTIKQDGIHYATLGIKELFENNQIPVEKALNAEKTDLYGFPPTPGFAYPWDYEYRFTNKKTGKYRILVIRDSFGDAILPFLKEAFEESVFIFDAWTYSMDKEIIEKVKPDIILYITLETHLENLLAH